jgi:hypothetical protein
MSESEWLASFFSSLEGASASAPLLLQEARPLRLAGLLSAMGTLIR